MGNWKKNTCLRNWPVVEVAMTKIYNGNNNSDGNLEHYALLDVTGVIGFDWGEVHAPSLQTSGIYGQLENQSYDTISIKTCHLSFNYCTNTV